MMMMAGRKKVAWGGSDLSTRHVLRGEFRVLRTDHCSYTVLLKKGRFIPFSRTFGAFQQEYEETTPGWFG